MGAFGALGFAHLAPGSTVIAFSPQTTLDQSRHGIADLEGYETRLETALFGCHAALRSGWQNLYDL